MPITPAYLRQLHTALGVLEDYLREQRVILLAEANRLDAAPPPVPTVDEYIAQATSATAIWKALEPELRVDRRTILARVERIALSTGVHKRLPDWSTNVAFARKLAEKLPSGERRITAALRELDAPRANGVRAR